MPEMHARGRGQGQRSSGKSLFQDARLSLIQELEELIKGVQQIMENLPSYGEDAVPVELDYYAEYFASISTLFIQYYEEMESKYYEVLNNLNEGITTSAQKIITVSRDTAVFIESYSLNPASYSKYDCLVQIQYVLSSLRNLTFYCSQ